MPGSLAVRGEGKLILETEVNSLDSSVIGLSHFTLPLSMTQSDLLVILSLAASLVTDLLSQSRRAHPRLHVN